MTEDIQQLKSFTLFPTLPEELRVQIFEEFIFLSPRIIEVCQRRNKNERNQTHHDNLDGDAETEETRVRIRILEPALDSTGDNLTAPNLSVTADETKNETENEPENEAAEVDDSSSSSSSDSNSTLPDEDENREDSIDPPNPNPYYTSTPLPVLLHTTRLSRQVTLRHYTLSFPNPTFHPPKIYYNPRVDTLYFPTWAFPYRLEDFENLLPQEVKNSITRIAVDNLMWNSYWDDGSMNGVFQIDQFKNVEEVLLVHRGQGNVCGCCMEFDGPEEGIVGFEKNDVEERKYEDKVLRDCWGEFGKIAEKDREWNMPEVKFVRLLRGGVVV